MSYSKAVRLQFKEEFGFLSKVRYDLYCNNYVIELCEGGRLVDVRSSNCRQYGRGHGEMETSRSNLIVSTPVIPDGKEDEEENVI